MNSSKSSKSRSDSPGKPTMKLVRRAMPGTAARTFSRVLRKMSAPLEGDARYSRADLFQGLEKDVCAGAALHCLEDSRRGVLERNVEIFADVVVLGDGVEEFAGDAVGIGV